MSGADDAIPEVLRREREEQLGDTLPTQLTIAVSPLLAVLLQADAISGDRSLEYVARRFLELWAEKRLSAAKKMLDTLAKAGIDPNALGGAGDLPQREAKKPEHEYKLELAAAIELRGLRVQTELNTGAGDADIAVYGEGQTKPLAIVEVKVALSKWRDVHHATGQAQAYAKAAGAKLWFVAAGEIDPRLVSAKVLHIGEAASVVAAAVEARLMA